MTIQNGAAATTGDAFLGGFDGSMGTLTLTDPGSSWTASNVTVGDHGCGTLSVLNGAMLSAASLHIGSNVETEGSLVLKGQGLVVVDGTLSSPVPEAEGAGGGSGGAVSTLAVAGDLFVGEWGVGEMDIVGGGSVTSNTGFVGTNGGSTGTLLVDGKGSQWKDANFLTIGTFGSGNATVSDGGSVTAGNILVGENAGGVGSLTVDGGAITTPTSLEVGKGGNGTLMVMGGGTVMAGTLGVGELGTGVGEVMVSGGNVTVTGSLVGDAGGGESGEQWDAGDGERGAGEWDEREWDGDGAGRDVDGGGADDRGGGERECDGGEWECDVGGVDDWGWGGFDGGAGGGGWEWNAVAVDDCERDVDGGE